MASLASWDLGATSPNGAHRHVQARRVVALRLTGSAVQVDEGSETLRLSADDGVHDRQAEPAGADRRVGVAAGAHRDAQVIPVRTGEDPGAVQRRPEATGPGDRVLSVDGQEQL